MTDYTIDSITLKTYLKGSPAKLEFSFLNFFGFEFEEGDAVFLKAGELGMFYGYIFTREKKHDGICTITAYDQLRYLTCRDTLNYSKKTASDLIKNIATNFNLKTGEIENTGYLIDYRLEENQTILDIIYTAINLTTEKTGKSYVFFDDFGKLSLKRIDNMKLPFILDFGGEVLNYNYTSSIDKDVYNSVKVSVKNTKTKAISTYVKSDEKNKGKWGSLQYFKRLPNTYTKAQAEEHAQSLLSQKNRLKKTLKLKDFGEPKVRAGSTIAVKHENKTEFMLVDYCKHNIKSDSHTMDLTLQQI